jgi:uncharacterized membrane protein YdjX (TVP38/TMEM64 family)
MSYRKILLITVVLICIAMFRIFDLGNYLTLDSLKANRQMMLDLYVAHPFRVVAGFMAVYILQTALSLPGAAIMSLAAGAVFGATLGTIYANIAATCGAMLAFLATRYLLHDLVDKRFGTRLSGLNRELEKRGLNYLLFLRLVPIFPFFLINLAAGLTRIPLRTFFIGTLVGIIPGGFVFCNAGASLAAINSLSDIASPRVISSFVLLGLFALLPAIYAKVKRKKT